MKQVNPIREQLGLTQQDIAMVLGITRSQWSLYELGKRDLPLEASKLLAEMLSHVKKAETSSKKPGKLSAAKSQKELEHLLSKNEYRIVLVNRAIKTIEKKLHKNTNALVLADFLRVREDKKAMAGFIDVKASKSLEKASLDLMRNKIKLELLKLERPMLKAELEKLLKP
jgi:transcriptional regulator with XRE-family HTH domain